MAWIEAWKEGETPSGQELPATNHGSHGLSRCAPEYEEGASEEGAPVHLVTSTQTGVMYNPSLQPWPIVELPCFLGCLKKLVFIVEP